MRPIDALVRAPISIALLPIEVAFACRAGCGACCIAPSISSPIPGMPNGKPAGVRCVQLSAGGMCALFGLPQRPTICSRLRAEPTMCGIDAIDAGLRLDALELATAPAAPIAS